MSPRGAPVGWRSVPAGPLACDACPDIDQYSSRIWVSVDGRAWTAATVPNPDGSYLYSVAAGPSGLVAVGSQGIVGTPAVPLVLVSADGLTWTRVDPPEFAAGSSIHQVVGGSMYVAVGSRPGTDGEPHSTIWTSVNGTDWTEVYRSTTEGTIGELIPNGTGWMAVGSEYRPTTDPSRSYVPYPVAWTSDDGASWIQRNLPDLTGAVGGEAMATLRTPAGLLAIGYAEYHLSTAEYEILGFAGWRSADGVTWQPATVTDDFHENIGGGLLLYQSPDRIFGLGSPCLCGSGGPGRWWTTDDGLNWVEHAEQPPVLHAVIPYGSGLLGVGIEDGKGVIFTSE